MTRSHRRRLLRAGDPASLTAVLSETLRISPREPLDWEVELAVEQLRHHNASLAAQRRIAATPVAPGCVDLSFDASAIARLRWQEVGDPDVLGWRLEFKFPEPARGDGRVVLDMRDHVEPLPLRALRLIARRSSRWDPDVLDALRASVRDDTCEVAIAWGRREIAGILVDHWSMNDEPLPLPLAAWIDDAEAPDDPDPAPSAPFG